MNDLALEQRHLRVLNNSIIYDAVCPLAQNEPVLDELIKGGVNVVAPTVGGPGTLEQTLHSLGIWYERLRRRPKDLMLISRVEDIERAKKENKLGIIFHLQGTTPIGRDLNLVQLFYQLGIRIMQLTYNVKDYVGDGCEEPGNGGLSDFGKNLVQEMNRVGMVVDLSHTGHKTTMDAMNVSNDPCVFSHSNCKAVFKSNRNIEDDQIASIASSGGVIGITAFPGFVSNTSPQPTKNDLLSHFDHLIEYAGIDHIGVGSDYFDGQQPYLNLEEAEAIYKTWIESGAWKSETYRPPPYIYPEGIETPERFSNLSKILLEHELAENDVSKILGGNFMRVYKEVWH